MSNKISLQAALDLLKAHPEQYKTRDSLLKLADQINVKATGDVTILSNSNAPL